MVKISAFDWDNLYITPDEDPAYAGDKDPNSSDDKECGDHFIPKDKDCHDGNAHRPAPGENPYWTDENSKENRDERGADWDDNKPKPSKAPEIDEDDINIPGPTADQLDALDAVPEGQRSFQDKQMSDNLRALSKVYRSLGQLDQAQGKGGEARRAEWDQKATSLEYASNAAEEGGDPYESAATLKAAAQEVDEWLNAHQGATKAPEMYQELASQAEFAADAFLGSVEPDDPRDIMVWDKVRNRPDQLEVEDLLQLSGLRKVDIEGDLSPAEQKYADKQIRGLKTILDRWRESPTYGGEYLASQFMKKPKLIDGTRGKKMLDESPFQTNPKLALAILDRTARAGDHPSNKKLWEDFGLSEEWHDSSFLFDERKAIDKATREMKTMADWSGVDAADRELMMSGVGMAEAEDALEAKQAETGAKREELFRLEDEDKITREQAKKANMALFQEERPFVRAVEAAHLAMLKASEKVGKAALEMRGQLMDSMAEMNKLTRPDTEITSAILYGASTPQWAPVDESDSEYRTSDEGLAGKKLLILRNRNREQNPAFSDPEGTEKALSTLFSIAHGNLFEDPALKEIKWQSEVFERAHAGGGLDNFITLGVHPKKKIRGKFGEEVEEEKGRNIQNLDRADVAVHEFAHHLEFRNPDMTQRVQEFYERRTAGQEIVTKGTHPDHPEVQSYGEYEAFKDDHFYSFYCGKTYKPDQEYREEGMGTSNDTELTSMGIQAFFNDSQWELMVRQDRQHLALVIAALRGY